MADKFLMCNMAWMKRYEGILRGDYPINGGAFIDENGHGHEVINFKQQGKYVYGYVQARNHTIDIDRLGAEGREYIDGIDVVWRAKSKKGAVVVGWYRNARVYRVMQPAGSGRSYKYEGDTHYPGYLIRALSNDVTLLQPSHRIFRVPVTHKGFGSQTFVTYLQNETPEVVSFRQKLAKYMSQVEKGNLLPITKGKKGKIDTERRSAIERSAIEAATNYYVDLGFNVKSVESENDGYDLIATQKSLKIFVEVKGTSVSSSVGASVLLTPNEYKASKSIKKNYRIVIVVDALGKKSLHEFSWDAQRNKWFSEDSLCSLKINEVVAANLRISSHH